MTAERLMLLGGMTAFVLTIYWLRNRRLRERYAIGWLAVATLLLLCGLFPNVIMQVAHWAHLSYPAAVLFVALTATYCFSFLVTVSLSHQHRQSTRLLQEIAILKHRLAEMELQTTAERNGTPQAED
jgi:hypothetical protein